MDLNFKEIILEYLKDKAKKPVYPVDLVDALKISGENLNEFYKAIEELEQEFAIVQNKSGKYGLPKQLGMYFGRINITSKGFGFFIPDKKNGEAGKAKENDVFIPEKYLNGAMNNDRVLVKITDHGGMFFNGYDDYERSAEGVVIKVIEHVHKRVVGTFESSRTFGFVVPDDTKLKQDIFIEGSNINGAKVGMKVVVEIIKWPTLTSKAEGKIVEVLGKVGSPGVDILSVIRQYDLAEEFPKEVCQMAQSIEQKPDKNEYKNRKDRRALQIVTIDGEDAKDLDDGVYVEQLANGNFFLGVYIADVSHYVKEFNALDKEAYSRGTSVYLADRVIPMLPVELSNGICSLNAGEDRLSMCIEMEIDNNGTILNYEISPAVIHVYRRLTYSLVNRILTDKEEAVIADNKDILPLLENLHKVHDALARRRHMRGAINFDTVEVKVKLNSQGQTVGLIKRERGLGESIIEECMLVANETVAEHMARKDLPFIYRIHENPTQEKIQSLNNLLANFNLHLIKDENGEIKPKSVQKVLESIKDKPEEKIISAVALRSMQQAKYSAENLGHFGLAAKYYTHFTSPIRRYPDLLVHRLLKEQLNGQLSQTRQDKLKARLPEIAVHTSKRERIATEAERDTLLIKEIEYMACFLGEEFDGIISGVTAFGIFVELDNGVEGLVHVSTMINDYYEFIESEYALVGEMSNFKYRLGDSVKVVLTRASVKERAIDFILKGNGRRPAMLEDDIIAEPIFAEFRSDNLSKDSEKSKTNKKKKDDKKVESDKKGKKKNKSSHSDNKNKRKSKKELLKTATRKSKKHKDKFADDNFAIGKNGKKAKKKKQSAFYDDIYAKKSSKKSLAKAKRRKK